MCIANHILRSSHEDKIKYIKIKNYIYIYIFCRDQVDLYISEKCISTLYLDQSFSIIYCAYMILSQS